MLARPHDALFKSAFEDPAAAAALLRALLPAAIREIIAWDTLDGEPASFVDPALGDHHGDLLFSARLRTSEPALIFVLLEHQSTEDPAMSLVRCRIRSGSGTGFAGSTRRPGFHRSSPCS
jgi:predicted transposase/invertase (TIGR01784 family)